MTSSSKLAFLSAATAALLVGFTATSQACSWGENMTVWKPDSSTVADSGTVTKPVTKPEHDG